MSFHVAILSGVLLMQNDADAVFAIIFGQDFSRTIPGTVIHDDDFGGKPGIQYPFDDLTDGILFVIDRDKYGQFHAPIILPVLAFFSSRSGQNEFNIPLFGSE